MVFQDPFSYSMLAPEEMLVLGLLCAFFTDLLVEFQRILGGNVFFVLFLQGQRIRWAGGHA